MKTQFLAFPFMLSVLLCLASPRFAGEPWQAFPAGEVKVSGADGKKAVPKTLALAFDGKPGTTAVLGWLNGAEVTLEFAKPLRIGNLVLVQSDNDELARPASLELTVDNRFTRLAGLADRPGEPQSVPVDAEVSHLRLRVASIHTRRRIQRGGLGEIGFTPAGSVLSAWPAAAAVDAAPEKPPAAAVAGRPERALKITPWAAGEFSATAMSGGGGAPKTLAAAFAAKGGNVQFNPMRNACLEIEFPAPRALGLVAFQQGDWKNWAKVRTLGVAVDGGPERTFLLADLPGPQAVDIGATARRITFTVRDVHPGKGVMAWGGFTLVGPAEFEPVTHSTAAAPFPMTATALDIELDADQAMEVPLSAQISSFRLTYQGPTLSLAPGRRTYRVDVGTFKETRPFGLDWKACHIRNVNFDVDPKRVDPGFRLLAVRPVVPPGAPEDPWYDLGKFDPPVREIGGERWREGMSYSSSGRFGNSTYNGLLSEVVGDLWFHTYTAGARDQLRRQKFDLYIEGNEPGRDELDSAQSWRINGVNRGIDEEIENSWTHMSRKMKLKGNAELTWLAGSLAPGFLGDSSKPLTISSRGGGDIPKRSGAPDEDENRFFRDADRDADTRKIGPTLVVTPSGVVSGTGEVRMETLSAPWIVAVWGGLKRPAFWGDRAAAILITLDRGRVSWDREGINLPAGRFGISSSFHGLFTDPWKEEDIRARAKLLCGMLRNYPYRCAEFYRVVGDTVRIRNEFTYEAWGDPKHRAADFAPLPPMFAWASLDNQWGRLPLDPKRTIRTPAGPYAWNPGAATTYTLPVPANRHAAFPRNADFEAVNRELAEKFLAQPDPKPEDLHRIADAWKTAYPPLRVGSSLFGMSYLGDDFRERTLKTLHTTIANAFRDFAWVPRKEQFGGLPYLASLWVDDKVSPVMYGDVNSGIGAANYGLYAYSKYSGDWELARRLWPRVLDTIRFCEVVNDWAIPMTSAREGILFGGIDMDTIGYLGVSAAERLARQVGTPEDLDRLVYLRSKLAPATALRMTFQRYLDPEGEHPRLWVNGFSESGPNLEWASSDSGVGMDHMAMMYCWQGQQPEMYQFLMQLPGVKTMTALQKELMDKYFTGTDFAGWRKMPFNHTRTAAHLAMRAWLPGWDRAELERDYGIWVERTKKEINAYNAGFFGVYQGAVDRVYLIDWEPAALDGLDYDRPSKTLTARLRSERPFTLEGSAPGKIAGIQVDGKDWPLSALRYEEDRFFLELPSVGKEIKFRF